MQVPAASWKAERLESDLDLSKQLIIKLDAEKNIDSNPLIQSEAAAIHAATGTCHIAVIKQSCQYPAVGIVASRRT